MSHKKPSDDLPDFNAFFKNELGPCKAPRKKPKPDEFPPHLRPGNPDRWDDNAKHYAALWRLELIKELEDKILGFILTVIALPIMAIIALAIRLDSPGPVLFRQKRFGFNNDEITV